jgi:FkbM family methyltransferase
LAYEPIESTYLSLLDNISLNNCKNIKAFNFGIAGKSEVKTFNYSKEASILSSMILNVKNEKKIKIKCITLEDIITDNKLENIDLLKIDCEGAEFEIFYSTKKEYLQKIKEIRMEYHNFEKQGCNITELTKFLENNNFYLVKKVEANCDLGIAWFVNGEAR